jgi:hypothetical protein
LSGAEHAVEGSADCGLNQLNNGTRYVSTRTDVKRGGPWHAHLMFFIPLADSATWGAGLQGSPAVAAFNDTQERHTVLIVSVAKWSDGTPDSPAGH